MKLVVFGLTISSSWGNGHATTYRSLLKAFAGRGHQIVFYEWDAPWYSGVYRDLPKPGFVDLRLYSKWADVRVEALRTAESADAALVGSYVHEGAAVVDELVRAAPCPLYFYDIDTPVTVASLRNGGTDHLRTEQVPHFTRYLSFTGGPFLEKVIVGELGARAASPLYCSVDPTMYRPLEPDPEFAVDLAYMGTYAADRQGAVDRLLVDVARALPDRTFLVAGPQYPEDLAWPANVRRIPHVPPHRHPAFYSSARWQLNATRADMVAAGWSPSVRLFEAGAVGASMISDAWPGMESFFSPGREILLPASTEEVVTILEDTSDSNRIELGDAMRRRILAEHTSDVRAGELEDYLLERVPAGI